MTKKQPPTWIADSAGADPATREIATIAQILQRLPARDRWCVEFGAWDGVIGSNTRAAILEDGYSAVLIEGDKDKFQLLKEVYADRPNVTCINAMVGVTAATGLDSLLHSTPIPRNFDFMSIDIDGQDYLAWQAVTQYYPKVVCIEFNPTMSTDLDFVQPVSGPIFGSSLAALVRLGREKGYSLVSTTRVNAYFVRDDLFRYLDVSDNRPEVLRRDLEYVTHVFSGFDGTVRFHGYRRLPWHGIELDDARVQPLPKWLRKYPSYYSKCELRATLVLLWAIVRKRQVKSALSRFKRSLHWGGAP